MKTLSKTLSESIREIIFKDIVLDQHHDFSPDPFWEELNQAGTELWLDTGDIEEAEKIWTGNMTALTTNNTLLNNEIQKGIYDHFIAEANYILHHLPIDERVVELAFVLNARHGLKLVEKFGGKVSVELHTDLSFDREGIVEYGKRFYKICPNHFIIKVPYTAEGLLGARDLRKLGIPINFTLEFSARQNALVAMVVKPNYLNVFLGRLNAFVAENKLGTGDNVGEKTTWASQKIVKELTAGNKETTRQIAASMRNYLQLQSLAGIDVFTMPTKVAMEGHQNLKRTFQSQRDSVFGVELFPWIDRETVRLEKLWDVTDKEKEMANIIDRESPQSGDDIKEIARQMGCGDMFPRLDNEEMALIVDDGKIPKHSRWANMIRNQEIAVDTLMNLGGLAAFTADQQAMDNRIRKLITD
jgi:transaldolase